MSEMIEKVAIAMRGCIANDWAAIGETAKAMYRKEAQAAIEAMREPTQAMLDTVTAYDQEEPFSDATMRSVYQEMVDAALSVSDVQSQTEDRNGLSLQGASAVCEAETPLPAPLKE